MNDHPASLVPAFDSKVIMMTMMMMMTIDMMMMMKMKKCEKRVCAKLQAAQLAKTNESFCSS